MKLVRYWYYWVLDYWYVTFRQVIGMGKRDPTHYATGSAEVLPVLILPGVYERWGFLRPLIEAIHAGGHPVYVLEKLGYNRGEIPAAAEQVAAAIRELGLARVAIVAHSKGGLIGKYAMSFNDPDRRIEKMVAVSTPFSGSVLARFIPLRSVHVFSPAGEVIQRLGKETAVNSRIVSVYGEFDPHIPGGSHLEGAKNIRVPVVGHFRITANPEVISLVVGQID